MVSDLGSPQQSPTSDSHKSQQPPPPSLPLRVGGSTDQPAFCLLDGYVLQSSSSQSPTQPQLPQPFRLPITRLPANLGRTHVPAAEHAQHFFSLGTSVKAMSRLQARISYRVGRGEAQQGSIGPLMTARGDSDDGDDDKSITTPTYRPSTKPIPTSAIPSSIPDDVTGYYVLECLGKNSIKVNGERVEQYVSVVLSHGSTIKISSMCLYFLLPQQPPPGSATKPRTIEIPLDNNSDADNNNNKRKTAPEATRSEPKLAAAHKKQRGNTWTTIQEQLDSLSTDELLEQLKQAVADNVWDRKHQFMGATVAYRAVRAAAAVPGIKSRAQAEGVSKAEIVEWIQTSAMFQEWAETMQQKLEPKSYQSSISKAMARAGYERINNKNFGRHVRWSVPSEGNDDDNDDGTTTQATTPAPPSPPPAPAPPAKSTTSPVSTTTTTTIKNETNDGEKKEEEKQEEEEEDDEHEEQCEDENDENEDPKEEMEDGGDDGLDNDDDGDDDGQDDDGEDDGGTENQSMEEEPQEEEKEQREQEEDVDDDDVDDDDVEEEDEDVEDEDGDNSRTEGVEGA